MSQGRQGKMHCSASASLLSTGATPDSSHAFWLPHLMAGTRLKITVQPRGCCCESWVGIPRFVSRRLRSIVVVTNSFHQLRSYLAFRCAVQQSLPKDRQVQASASSILYHTTSVILCQVHPRLCLVYVVSLDSAVRVKFDETIISQALADILIKCLSLRTQQALALNAGLACTCAGGGSEPDRPQPSEGVQFLGLLQGTCSVAVLLAQRLAVPKRMLAEIGGA